MMRQIKFTILLISGIFFLAQPTQAMVESISASKTEVIEQQKKESKKELRRERRVAKYEKLFKKAGIDLSDPVKKWLWLALGFGVASIFLSIFFGGLLAGVAWSAAGVCLIIWLLKYLDIV